MKNGMLKNQGKVPACVSPVNAVHLIISISYLQIRHLRKYLVMSHEGFACSVGRTLLQLVIVSLAKLGVKCEEGWTSTSPCTEHLRPGELAVNRLGFLFS